MFLHHFSCKITDNPSSSDSVIYKKRIVMDPLFCLKYSSETVNCRLVVD